MFKFWDEQILRVYIGIFLKDSHIIENYITFAVDINSFLCMWTLKLNE